MTARQETPTSENAESAAELAAPVTTDADVVPQVVGRRAGLRANLGALRVPAYRRYIAGTTANNITVWLFQTALSWTILTETGSAAGASRSISSSARTFPPCRAIACNCSRSCSTC